MFQDHYHKNFMQRILKISIVFYSIIFIPLFNFAQSNKKFFERVSLEQGLSSSSVFSIVQDSLGFMWFATEDGLNRYDGYTCKVYRHQPADSSSLVSSSVKKLFIDSHRHFWIITQDGRLDRYLQREDRFLHYHLPFKQKKNQKKLKVSTLTQDSTGQVWLGLNNGDLFYYDQTADKFYPFKLNGQFFKQKIHLQTMFFDHAGNLWLGTWEGLFKWHTTSGRLISIAEKYGKALEMIFALSEDHSGRIWIASANQGLYYFDSNKEQLRRFNADPNDFNSNRTVSLLVDSKSNLWVGTVDQGLFFLTNGCHPINHYAYDLMDPWSVVNGAILTIYEDRRGSIWIGSYGGGVCRYNPNRLPFHQIAHRVSDKNSLSSNLVLSICKDHNDALWIGTDGGGLNVLTRDSESFLHFFQKAGAHQSNSITALIETSDGQLWLGMDVGTNQMGGPLYCFNRESNRFEKFTLFQPRFSGISAFMEDRSGRLWIATFSDGLYCYDHKIRQVTHFKATQDQENSLSGNSILSLLQDQQGRIWIGTLNHGLNCLEPERKTFTHYQSDPRNPESLAGNTIFSMARDNKGRLWFGTNGGLSAYSEQANSFSSITYNDGLPGNLIFGILTDENNNLWLSTNRGLVSFDPEKGIIKKYGPGDGLLNLEFTQGACYKDRDGNLFFGGNRGLTYFNPAQFKMSHYEPLVVITDFQVKGKHLPLTQSILFIRKIVLKHSQNFFSFRFAALGEAVPAKVEYAYRLNGVDENWVYSGHRRFANYTDIMPGRYVFEVKATNNDGVWSKNSASIGLVILPPFWQRWWFRLLALLALAALLFAAHTYRLNRKLEVERTRLRIARDLHDDVSATITGIAYFTEALERQVADHKTPALEKLFTLIRESVNNVQDSMSDIIWAIKPENDRWETFFPKLRRFASEMCESKAIDYTIDMPQLVPVRELTMELRRNIWLIFKELITNSVKHSSCKQMKIWLKLEKKHLLLHVEDDGRGFDPHEQAVGNGLTNIYKRCQALKGKAKLETAPGKGVRWEIYLPF